MKIIVSEIQIVIIKPQNGHLGFASCVIQNQFYVGNIAIYQAPANSLGYRLVFPTKKLSSGQQIPCFYPFTKEAEEAVTTAIVSKYLELMGNFQ